MLVDTIKSDSRMVSAVSRLQSLEEGNSSPYIAQYNLTIALDYKLHDKRASERRWKSIYRHKAQEDERE